MQCLTCKIDGQVFEKVIARANERGISRSEYLRSLVEADLFIHGDSHASPESAVKPPSEKPISAGRVRHHDYRQLPPNYDGSPQQIMLDSNGDARAVVKRADGKQWTWIKHKGSEEWIPIAKLVS